MSQSQVRQNFHAESEAGINGQINMELYASYAYLSMAAYFDRDDVALQNFSEYFKKAGHEEREHAEKLIKYQNMRGGRVTWQPIKAPPKADWESPLGALQSALQLEKDVNQSLLNLHEVADKHRDSQMTDYLEGEFLKEQVEAIKELGDHITNIKRVGAGLGEYVFDKETLG